MADLKISALTASTTPLAGTEVLPIVQSSTTKQVSVANLTAGRVVSVGNLAIPNGTEAAPSIYAVADATSGIYSSGTSATSFSFAGKLAGEFTGANGYWNIYRRNATSQYLETSVTSAGANILVSAGAGVLNLGIGATSYLKISGSGDVTLNSTNLVIGTSGKGIDFSATAGTGTSELLADYEEGDWTPADGSGAGLTFTGVVGRYTKIGQIVTFFADLTYPATASAASSVISGLPFAANSALNRTGSVISTTVNAVGAAVPPSTATVLVFPAGSLTPPTNATLSTARLIFAGSFQV